jgi:hypothetical protein
MRNKTGILKTNQIEGPDFNMASLMLLFEKFRNDQAFMIKGIIYELLFESLA